MSDQVAVPPPIPTNVKPKRKWRWWQTVLALIFGADLVFKMMGGYDSVSLQVQMDRNGTLVVTNTGTKPIEIQRVTINDRKDCRAGGGFMVGLGDFQPKTLQVGDQTFINSVCNIVRVTFETDLGASTYSFSR